MPRTARAIKFRCPHCSKTNRVPAKYAGRKGKCPGCLERVRVPALEDSPRRVRERPTTFLYSYQNDDSAGFGLLVVGADSLRVLEGSVAFDEDVAALEPSALIEAVAPHADTDQRIPTEQVVRVAGPTEVSVSIWLRGEDEPISVILGEDHAARAFALLEKRLSGFSVREEEVPQQAALEELKMRAMTILIAGSAFYWLAWVLGGESVHTGTLKRGGLIAGLANGLGTNGVLAVTVVLLALVGLKMYHSVSFPKKMAVLTRAPVDARLPLGSRAATKRSAPN